MRHRYVKSFYPVLLVILLGTSVDAFAQKYRLPDSPTGNALTALLEAIAGGEAADVTKFVEQHFDERFRKAFSMDQHVSMFQQIYSEIHPFEVASVEKTDEYSAEAVLSPVGGGASLKVSFTLLPDPPYKFDGIRFEPVAEERPEFTSFDELADYLAGRAQEGTFSGVALVAEGGEVRFEEAYGLASKRYRVPNTAETRFNIGSLNKMFTGVAILQLAQAGKLDLDERIGEYLTGFPEGVASKVTVRHLLQHSSGWGDYFDNDYYRDNWTRLRNVDDYMGFLKAVPLSFEPGSSRRYSNAGYVVLGAIIESVSGEGYYDYVRNHIFRPVAMTSTDSYEADETVENLAMGYVRSDEGGYTTENTFRHSVRGTPAGGGYSTARDLLAFVQALRGYDLLDQEHTGLFFNEFEQSGTGDKPSGELGLAGGGPGINAVVEMNLDRDLIVIVLSNFDPPTAEELGPRIMRMAKAG